MSNKSKSEGRWETHSYTSTVTKIGDGPTTVAGKETSASGTFDNGKRVVTESHTTTFTNENHAGKLEYKSDNELHQKSIK